MAYSAKTPYSEEDNALLARASAFSEFSDLPLLTAEKLREITTREGVNFATALLYDRVKRSPRHSSFIARIDELQSRFRETAANRDVTIAVVPAAYYKENPRSGADGRLVREEAVRLGLSYELIPLLSTGTLAENSRILLDWMAMHRGQKIILVSLCKGGADVKFALGATTAPEHFSGVLAWVNICGTLDGSPVAEWLLATKPGFFVAWLYCKCKRHSLTFLRELAPSSQGPLSTALKLPASMPLINLVGFPLRKHLTNRFMRQCHQRVSRQGPSDGGVLLAHACQLPGVIYPVWGADHYLRPESRARQIIGALLEYLTGGDNREELCLANETPAIDRIAQMPLA